MMIALHKNVRTTPDLRGETASALAQSYGITEQTVCK